ncbi:hypothetical protein PP707_04830, partial [Acetobacter pasteurianus]|nr:hypothetical protein [Acetobacter pasteurianus]
ELRSGRLLFIVFYFFHQHFLVEKIDKVVVACLRKIGTTVISQHYVSNVFPGPEKRGKLKKKIKKKIIKFFFFFLTCFLKAKIMLFFLNLSSFLLSISFHLLCFEFFIYLSLN